MALTPEQFASIKKTISLGRTLQIDHPEIAELYREGYTWDRISKELDIPSRYEVRENYALRAVYYAIAGHAGEFRTGTYEGLILDEERERIGMEHMTKAGRETRDKRRGIFARTAEQMAEDRRKGSKASGKKVSLKTYEERRGIHGRTAEQMTQDGRKGGKAAHEKRKGIHALTLEERSKLGVNTYNERLGVHGLTHEEHRECGRKSAITRGKIPWSEEETGFIYQLSLQPEYQRGSVADIKLITTEVNKIFYNGEEVRNNPAIRSQLYKHKKSLKNKIA